MSAIEQFQKALFDLPQVDLRLKHEFCEGLYARTIIVPAGVAIVGAIHRSENYLFVRSGRIYIKAGDNGSPREFEAGDMILSQPGVRRIGYAVEETVLTTVHANPTNETDPELIWELYTISDISEIENEIRGLL